MAFRLSPRILLVSGSLSWVAFSLLHLYSVSLDLDFIKASYTSLYLLFLGVFVISFYKYYDLLFSEVSRKNIFSTFFTLFVNSIKLAVPVFLFFILLFFEVGKILIESVYFQSLSYNFIVGISFLFLLINFIVYKRLIFFEASSLTKSIFNLFQYGALFIFLFDILYNFFPSSVYQYFLVFLFMVGGILFFNQKWIAYMHFDEKWKTIIFSLFLLSGIFIIYQFFSIDFNYDIAQFEIKSSLLFILLMAFNFTYISISILINIFNLPTSPVFDSIQNERYIARKVQEDLIPNSLPNTKKLKITSSYMPHFALGGDYYDYIPLTHDKFLICIADVSGKGIPAALLMSNVQASLRTMARQSQNLKKIVEELNFQINLRGLSERFVSMFLCIYSFKFKELEYVNCGHPHPIIYYDKKVETLDKGSTVLGMFQELPTFTVSKIRIKEGFTLFCYTDGIIEARNDLGDFYGSKRLLSLFSSKKSKPKKFIKSVIEDLNEFRGKNLTDDDITLLMTKVINE